jgi:hypothetical protein
MAKVEIITAYGVYTLIGKNVHVVELPVDFREKVFGRKSGRSFTAEEIAESFADTERDFPHSSWNQVPKSLQQKKLEAVHYKRIAREAGVDNRYKEAA